jgi:hypothetical protein
MEKHNYSPKDAKILRDNPDATLDDLRALGMSQKGSDAYAAEQSAKANAPRIDASKVEVSDPKPEPTVTESSVTVNPDASASAAKTLKPQLSPATTARQSIPEAQGSTFKQVRVMTPTGEVAVSQSAAKFLLTQPDHYQIND